MTAFEITDTVGSVVVRQPALARVFEQASIDYCCGGKKTVEQACREKGLDPRAFLGTLHDAARSAEEHAVVDLETMSLAELTDHIVRTHHVYLRSELPRLEELTKKVASVHGPKDSRLRDVRDTFLVLADELSSHMIKEEQLLFPMVRDLEASGVRSPVPCGTLANPIRQMELEHDEAGSALARLRDLTDGFTAPEWACNTHRALLDALARLERDLHEHIHKENNVLFPRALAMEERNAGTRDERWERPMRKA